MGGWVDRWMGGWVGEKDVEKVRESVLWRKGEPREGRQTWDQGTHAIATTLERNNARSTRRQEEIYGPYLSGSEFLISHPVIRDSFGKPLCLTARSRHHVAAMQTSGAARAKGSP